MADEHTTRQLRARPENAPKLIDASPLDAFFDETKQSRRLNVAALTKKLQKTCPAKILKPTHYSSDVLKLLQEEGFQRPIFVKAKQGDVTAARTQLDIKIPSDISTPQGLANAVGRKHIIPTMDVHTQDAGPKMSIQQMVDYLQLPKQERRRLLNVVSFSLADTRISSGRCRAPRAARKLNLVDRVWPEDDDPRPETLIYALLGPKGAYTDWHIDMGGSSVWYHIIEGCKVFLTAPPTKANLEAFEAWSNSEKQTTSFLGDLLTGCLRVVLRPGDTLFLPSNWPHAVTTPADSYVLGGNFLHPLDYYGIADTCMREQRLGVQPKFQYPLIRRLLWHAAKHLNDRLEESKHSDYYYSNDDHKEELWENNWEVKGAEHLIRILRYWLESGSGGSRRKDIPHEFIDNPSGLLDSLEQHVSEKLHSEVSNGGDNAKRRNTTRNHPEDAANKQQEDEEEEDQVSQEVIDLLNDSDVDVVNYSNDDGDIVNLVDDADITDEDVEVGFYPDEDGFGGVYWQADNAAGGGGGGLPDVSFLDNVSTMFLENPASGGGGLAAANTNDIPTNPTTMLRVSGPSTTAEVLQGTGQDEVPLQMIPLSGLGASARSNGSLKRSLANSMPALNAKRRTIKPLDSIDEFPRHSRKNGNSKKAEALSEIKAAREAKKSGAAIGIQKGKRSKEMLSDDITADSSSDDYSEDDDYDKISSPKKKVNAGVKDNGQRKMVVAKHDQTTRQHPDIDCITLTKPGKQQKPSSAGGFNSNSGGSVKVDDREAALKLIKEVQALRQEVQQKSQLLAKVQAGAVKLPDNGTKLAEKLDQQQQTLDTKTKIIQGCWFTLHTPTLVHTNTTTGEVSFESGPYTAPQILSLIQKGALSDDAPVFGRHGEELRAREAALCPEPSTAIVLRQLQAQHEKKTPGAVNGNKHTVDSNGGGNIRNRSERDGRGEEQQPQQQRHERQWRKHRFHSKSGGGKRAYYNNNNGGSRYDYNNDHYQQTGDYQRQQPYNAPHQQQQYNNQPAANSLNVPRGIAPPANITWDAADLYETWVFKDEISNCLKGPFSVQQLREMYHDGSITDAHLLVHNEDEGVSKKLYVLLGYSSLGALASSSRGHSEGGHHHGDTNNNQYNQYNTTATAQQPSPQPQWEQEQQQQLDMNRYSPDFPEDAPVRLPQFAAPVPDARQNTAAYRSPDGMPLRQQHVPLPDGSTYDYNRHHNHQQQFIPSNPGQLQPRPMISIAQQQQQPPHYYRPMVSAAAAAPEYRQHTERPYEDRYEPQHYHQHQDKWKRSTNGERDASPPPRKRHQYQEYNNKHRQDERHRRSGYDDRRYDRRRY